jgi:MFS transporter, ACS family, solute carrier family 17 (sodium-dependent inorganic phosphate cotransporter), other
MQANVPESKIASRGHRSSLPGAYRVRRRDVVIGLSFLASCLAYTDRVNMSVAAVAMQQQFGWTQTEKGFVLSSFFIGYMASLFISGWLATRFGGRRVLGGAVLVWSVCTLLTPAAALTSMSALLAVRIAMGVGESAMYPASYELAGRWCPVNERARAIGRVLSGIPVGQIVGLVVTGWILGHYAWPAAFYAFGVLGLVWALVWFRSVSNDPATDPRITASERELLRSEGVPPQAAGVLTWRQILGSRPVLALASGHFASNWTLYVLLAWLPSYFREVLHLSITSAGLFSAGPWLTAIAVTNIAVPVADRLIAHGVSTTATRKWMQCTGLVVSAAFLLALQGVQSSTTALLLVCAATGALALTWCGYAPGIIDVAPRHSALVNGFSNTVGTIPGIVGVAITGWLLDVTGTYSAAFILTAAVSVSSAIFFAVSFNARPLID